MRLATFNIYWLGNRDFVKWSGLPERADADRSLIGQVLGKLNADLVAFKENADLEEFKTALAAHAARQAAHMKARTYLVSIAFAYRR